MNRQKGMTLVEVLVALAITAMIVVSSATLMNSAMRGTRDNMNRQFAAQKAMSMLEELRALIQTQNGATTVVLDDFDNGTTNVPVLTTDRTILDANADAPASGNRRVGGQWLFSRRITVQKMRGVNDLRLVNVKVFINEPSGSRLLAEVAGVLSTAGENAPPTQVYDVYLVAIENVPGWWLYMQNILPFVQGAMQDLESRHPGLKFRQHWIKKLSYGRDPYYTPYLNDEQDSDQAIPSVYFYPGTMPAGSAVEKYYPPDFFKARVRIDANVVNHDTTHPYSLADQFNHAMRYEDERELFAARVAAGLEKPDEPTLRLLLDDMILRPRDYTNAIVINLHGELFPFPPVRNYSDAARTPETHPYVRAVTHSEKLRYNNNEALKLRVYSYHTNVTNPNAVPHWLGRNTTATPITVRIRNIHWTPASSDVQAITGGVDFDNIGGPDNYAVINAPATAGPRMWWSSMHDGADTVIRLYNSPLKALCVGSDCANGGLDPASRLYALEYIPSPVENLPDGTSPLPFTTNLASSGTGAKNTARWILTIPDHALPPDNPATPIMIETHIGLTQNVAANVSRTYAYRGTDQHLFGDATHDPHMPFTERYQFIGDPRHLPYADLKMPHQGSGLSRQNILGLGYNRYFDDFHDPDTNATSRWPGWAYNAGTPTQRYGIKNNAADADNDNDGWETRWAQGYIELDMHRMFQMLRNAIVGTNSVYTTMTGFSYYYIGIGGEIGYDAANNFPNSISVSSRPFTGVNGQRWEQSILGGVKYIRENSSGSNYWWSMNWLGELYPDSQWEQWEQHGNLPTGVGNGQFVRIERGNLSPDRMPAGTRLINTARRTDAEGSTTFFWSGTASSTFHHRSEDGTEATRASDGDVVAGTYKLPLPPTIANSRPFNLNVNDAEMNPDHFLQTPYGSAMTLGVEAEFYRHSTGIPGSALLSMRNSGNDAAFIVVNGLSPTGESGSAFIARWSFLSLVQSFMDAGLYTAGGGSPHPARVRELPRVAITYPNDDVDIENPTTLNVQWQSTWRRWDGLKYTPTYPDNFTEDTTVRFKLMYSTDNGRTWRYMRDGTGATEGVRPNDASYLQTATSYNWSVPAASFPRGNYVIRIEAYRDGMPLHYSFHQYRAFFKR